MSAAAKSNTHPARLSRRRQRLYYHCVDCSTNLVSKKGGRCRWCAIKRREINYKKQGVKPLSLLGSPNMAKLKPRGRPQHLACAGLWKIKTELATKHNIGICWKGDRCNIKTRRIVCQDTLLPCPVDGIRDFTALEEQVLRRSNAMVSNRRGGATTALRLTGGFDKDY